MCVCVGVFVGVCVPVGLGVSGRRRETEIGDESDDIKGSLTLDSKINLHIWLVM